MTLPTHATEAVDQFKVEELKPGETVVVKGRKINVKGVPTDDVITVGVIMTNQVFYNEGKPFPGLTKLCGVAVTSDEPRLLASAPPAVSNWVGNDISVGQRWQAGTCGGGRAICVDSITVVLS